MNLTEYKAMLEEWKKAREAATQGEWKAGRGDMMSYDQYGNFKNVYLPDEADTIQCRSENAFGDSQFIALSANHWTELIDAHIKAIEALKDIAKKVPHKVSREEAADMACEFQMLADKTLSQITGGGK